MKSLFSPTGASLILILLLSGCRFGNYSEDPKPSEKTGFKSVHLWFTQAKKLTTTVIFTDSTSHEVATAPLSAIPTSVLGTFTNPTYFAIPKDPSADPMFIGLNWSSYLTTSITSDGKISNDYLSKVSQLWDTAGCNTQIEIIQNGIFDKNQPGTATFSDGSSAIVDGHLKLTFSYLRVISGDCKADLQRLASCYQNGAGCSVDELAAAANLFDLYVRQTGALNIQDAPRVKGLAYEVQFE